MARRRSLDPLALLVAWFGLVALFGSALAADQTAPSAPRLAIKGYDPVAYFTEGRPTPGLPAFEQVWENARWRFASAANRDRFTADPDRYAPQYGGYCAYGIANGARFEVDPEAWAIVDGKLYLNYSKGTLKDWASDRAANIKRADANWPTLRSK
jgi:hypothetical protein